MCVCLLLLLWLYLSWRLGLLTVWFGHKRFVVGSVLVILVRMRTYWGLDIHLHFGRFTLLMLLRSLELEGLLVLLIVGVLLEELHLQPWTVFSFADLAVKFAHPFVVEVALLPSVLSTSSPFLLLFM